MESFDNEWPTKADLLEADAIALHKAMNDPQLEWFRMENGNVNMEAYLRWIYLGE